MAEILRGFWNCEWCNTNKIDGLVDKCPNCGKQKSDTVKYYMDETSDVLSKEELLAAGISEEECDGNHVDWICGYCDQLNNWSDTKCACCAADKAEAELEYGRKKLNKSKHQNVQFENSSFVSEPVDRTYESNDATTEDYHYDSDVASEENDDYYSEPQYESSDTDNVYKSYCSPEIESSRIIESINETPKTNKFKDFLSYHKSLFASIGIGLASLFLIGMFIYLLLPMKHTVHVSGFEWSREITVEEERTVKESGWSVPNGGRVYDEKSEIKSYKSVVDHYETITETKTRQVFSHNETTYTYQDNGNGTFSKIPHTKPVYKTETYTETRQEPVYKQVPVYDTKYYYEIERWFDLQSYPSSGCDKKPYWNTDYELEHNHRDTKREEYYIIICDDGGNFRVGYDAWYNTNVGNNVTVTRNRIGMEYKRELSNTY